MIEKPSSKKIGPIKKKAWTIFSRFIRLFHSNEHGLVKCFTCDNWGPWDIWAQAGHFIPGRSNRVLYDEKQVKPQCYNCNINLKGNWPKFLIGMTDLYGPEEVSRMILNANVPMQMKAHDHQEIYNRYKAEFKLLEKSR